VDASALVIHGEVDETVALGEVLAWARESEVPVIVLPGADHFFHRRLTTLKRLVMQNVAGAAQLALLGAEGAVRSKGPEAGDE
jgi:hypothetical protein